MLIKNEFGVISSLHREVDVHDYSLHNSP